MSTNGHILVVDDDPEICTALEEYLSYEGYRVSVALNGSEMRRIIEEAPVDLIIMDVKTGYRSSGHCARKTPALRS